MAARGDHRSGAAALYNSERGEGPVKLESLERIADLLKTSLPSLLGLKLGGALQRFITVDVYCL
jgi:hypothetical protein